MLSADQPADMERAAYLLRAGQLVAMPTETVYGLAANGLDPAAVGRIFEAKRRPAWDPLIVHVCDGAMLTRVVREEPPVATRLISAFWPGPLTLLLPRHTGLPLAVTAGRDLVGVRWPAHPVAQKLIQAAGLPLAAPSANLFGHVSPTTASHVVADLEGRIAAVLDAGPCALGVESTVLDPVAMVLYRQGGVSAADIERVTGQAVHVYEAPQGTGAQPASLPSPGVGIRHYAPRARLHLVSTEAELLRALQAQAGPRTGVMLPDGWAPGWHGPQFAWGDWSDAAELARGLYAGLRQLDAQGVESILCPLPEPDGRPLAEALRDRLLKAARTS